MLPSHQLFLIALSIFQTEIPEGTTKVINILSLISVFIQKRTIKHIHSNISIYIALRKIKKYKPDIKKKSNSIV